MIENPGDAVHRSLDDWAARQAAITRAEKLRRRTRRGSIFGAWVFSAFAAAYAIPPYVPHAALLVTTNVGFAIVFWRMKDRWVR